MPLLHSGSSFCRRLPTSSRIHNIPASIPPAFGGALWLDSSPNAASSVFCQVSLRHTPWGPPDALLWTACLLDLAPYCQDMPPSFFGQP
jgi:hypothetical protein